VPFHQRRCYSGIVQLYAVQIYRTQGIAAYVPLATSETEELIVRENTVDGTRSCWHRIPCPGRAGIDQYIHTLSLSVKYAIRYGIRIATIGNPRCIPIRFAYI